MAKTDEIQNAINGFFGENGGKFSNKTAIGLVANAIKVVCDPSVSDERKVNSALFAAQAALNSNTAGEEVEEAIGKIAGAIKKGE